MSRRPRFRFIPTLGISTSSDAARAVLGEGLGLPLIDEDDVHHAYGRGKLSLYVDTTGAKQGAGFLPMLGTDDLDAALVHLAAQGCSSRPMPWAEDAPGALIEGPDGIRFCVVPLEQVIDSRAQRFLDESLEGPPLDTTEGAAVQPASVHLEPTRVGQVPKLVEDVDESEG